MSKTLVISCKVNVCNEFTSLRKSVVNLDINLPLEISYGKVISMFFRKVNLHNEFTSLANLLQSYK